MRIEIYEAGANYAVEIVPDRDRLELICCRDYDDALLVRATLRSAYNAGVRETLERLQACLNDTEAAIEELWELQPPPRALEAKKAQRKPLDAWLPIETAPDGQMVVVGWRVSYDDEHPERHKFDYRRDGVWLGHEQHYQEWCAIAKPPESTGPSEEPPYTHWMPLAALPGITDAIQPAEGERT